MAADGHILPNGGASAAGAAEAAARRPTLLAFTRDPETEAALREDMAAAAPDGFEVKRARMPAVIAHLSTVPTPRVLIVDVAGEDQPLAMLSDLAQVVEPDVRVLVIGDREDVNFYRQVTRDLGALEYLYKPLIPDMVARHFGPAVARTSAAPKTSHGGRAVAVTGVRGGVGATTLAVNLAWHFATVLRRHSVLLDADLHCGSGAMLLSANAGPGLRTALEQPSRVDDLFVDRVTQPVADRLHVLAGEEGLDERLACAPGAAERLMEGLRRRHNYVVADVPFRSASPNRELLDLAHQRVLVMLPTLPCIRETLRLLALPNGPAQARRAMVVLNRVGMPGGLKRAQVIDALGLEPDVVVPDLPKAVEAAAGLGKAAAAGGGAFAQSIAELAHGISGTRTSKPSGWKLKLPFTAGGGGGGRRAKAAAGSTAAGAAPVNAASEAEAAA